MDSNEKLENLVVVNEEVKENNNLLVLPAYVWNNYSSYFGEL